MNQEKLQSLFYSFIEHREKDEVDGIFQERSIAEDCSSSITQCDNSSLGTRYQEQGLVLSPPVVTVPYATLTPTQANEAAFTGRRLAQLAEQYSSGCDEKSNISFETCCKIVPPEEHNVSVCIIRSDKYLNRVTKVTWKTCDKTAQSGIHYVGATGEIVFNEDETMKSIEIKILKFEDEAIDLRFKVELNDVNGIFNPKPLTILLKKTDNFYGFERDILNSLPSVPFSVDSIRFALDGQLSARAFHVALSHLCSSEEALPVQLALAFELGRLCLHKLKGESIIHILTDFFRMDDIDF